MQCVCLKFYVTEKQQHRGVPLYEWILMEAKKLGMPGGSAFRAIAGFGRHGSLHDESFFELAGELPVQVEFILEEKYANKLLGVMRAHDLNLFYASYAVEAGILSN